jgi:hypothetical protein
VADTREHKQVETTEHSGKSRRDFVRAMLADLRALERMLAEGRFEKGIRRVGSELEMFLTDGSYQPAPAALKMLEALKDPHFTTELGLFQLEVNGDPQLLAGDGFSRMEKQLQSLVDQTRVTAEQLEMFLRLGVAVNTGQPRHPPDLAPRWQRGLAELALFR